MTISLLAIIIIYLFGTTISFIDFAITILFLLVLGSTIYSTI